MNLFYTEPSDVIGDQLRLTGQEARHALKALRMRSGDTLYATDGKGNRYKGTVVSTNKDMLTARVEETTQFALPEPELTLAMGIIKKRDRLEFAAEKAVELGVTRILFFRAEHSEKTNIRLDRLENITLSIT